MFFLPYLYFFIFILLLFYFEKSLFIFNAVSAKSLRICVFYSFGFITVIFICCRGYIGADWYNYKIFFDSAPSVFESNDKINLFFEKSEWAKGFTFFNIVSKTISENYLFLQFLSGLLDIVLLHLVFREFCPNYYLLCWGLFFAFNGFGFEILYLRNTKSIYIFLISLKYINSEPNKLKYFFLNLLGLLFHSSALIYFPLYFVLKNKKHNHKIIYLFIFLIGIVFFFLRIQWIKLCLSQIVSFVPGKFGVRLGMYLRASQWAADYSFSLGMLERIFSFCLIYKYHNILEKQGLGVFLKLFYLYIFIYLYCSEFAIIIARVTALFIPSYWILYSRLYSLLKKKGKVIFVIIFLPYCLLKICIAMSVNWAFYENFLFSDCDPIVRQNNFF